MKFFYIETDQLTQVNKKLRYVYSETNDGIVSFRKVIDPETNDEISVEEMRKDTAPDILLNIATAYKANYIRVYF